uniref:Alpha-1,3/1,6-mannosyltransferase ALG2 n=1 Tax=Meloidogyne javanica TaxID=6303 RepID=A0A915N1Q8_MELJA
MRVIIIHPEQWNGGSDRCTIGFLRHFVQAGHQVAWLTTMIDDYWADEEFKGVEIHEVRLPLHPGDWFSQNIALAYHIIFRTKLKPDLIVADHSASCVPLLKWWFPKVHIMFYCHFPQQLVTPNRFFLYRWYSACMGLIEAHMCEYADMVIVNSEFTSKNFQAVMPSIPKEKLRVIYPPCDVDSLSVVSRPISRKHRMPNERYLFLSMNRFWPEKRLDIILDAAVQLKSFGLNPLIQMAGSVMPHIPESKIYYELLKEQCKKYNLEDIIEFIPDPNDEKKFELYRQCDSVIYTPPNEHFGIVPIEALEQRRPVIVIDSGGPSETVIEGVTGTKISDTDGIKLAEAMVEHMESKEWINLDDDAHYVMQRARFEKHFSLNGFGQNIDKAVTKIFGKDMNANNDEEQQIMEAHTNGFTSYTSHAKRQKKPEGNLKGKARQNGQDRKNA